DSFQISSGTEIKYPVDVMTIDYVPAEYHLSEQSKRTATENWDRFALAVSFYQILFGIHPFMATCDDSMDISTIEDAIKNGMFVHGSRRNHLTVIPHPHNKYNELPYQIKLLFSKAFNHNYEIDRPSAEEWGKTLHSELNQIRK
ncbi:MAG TPA: hypothetical protein VNY36_03665, partial [Bacteroidia bacterium]|nr:hypothetical protein [Bacteroidia bacterium]